jgi:hypothetical protein
MIQIRITGEWEVKVKKVYSRPTERDAVLLTDLEGDSIEISGPEIIAASLSPVATDILYRNKAWPHFCKAGEGLEIISMTTKKLIWSSQN